MRKLVLQEFISLDGYAADKDHSTRFFESPVYATGSDDDLLDEMNRFDAILLGAVTYRLFADYWPQATTKDQIVADRLNSIPKFVFSNTLKEAPWGKWPAATLIPSDAIKAIKKMKAQPGKDMVLWGSISLARDLIDANQVDEYQLRIVPLFLGDGIPLFGQTKKRNLELVLTKAYNSGLLLAHYIPSAI